MREGKELILATKRFAVERRLTSWFVVLSTLLILVGCLAGTAFGPNLLSRIGFSFLSGLVMVRFFVIYHDYQHNSILTKSRVAKALMDAFGVFVLAPANVWQRSHNYHHKHNSKLRGSHIGSFPIMTKENFLAASKAERRAYLFSRHPLTILFGYVFVFIGGMCVRPALDNPKKHSDSILALILHIGLIVGMFAWLGWVGVVLTVVMPFFIACAVGSYLFYAQHNFPDAKHTDDSEWTYHGAALESSSYLKTGPVMRWFTANIGYHHVHHLNAKIPFYRLREAMQNIKELQRPRITTLEIPEIIRCLRLKVWDTDAQRMIPLKQLSMA